VGVAVATGESVSGGDAHELDPDSLGDHVNRLYRAAWALCGSREDAEDLVQECYARVLARPRLIRRDGDFGYLLGALRNTFLAQRRLAASRPRTAMMPDYDDLTLADPRALDPQARVEIAEVYAAIAELPDDLRDAIVAVDVAGLSYAQAAKRLHATENAITMRLFRARKRLAQELAAQT
jgi:RNA polymerase sigma-70 factor (ECF subfamily)